MLISFVSDIHEFLPNIQNVDIAVFCGDFALQLRGDLKGEMKLWHNVMGPYLDEIRSRGIKAIGCSGNHDFLADSYSTRDLMARYFDLFMVDGLAQFEGFNWLFYSYCKLEDWAMFMPEEKQEQRCNRLSIAATVTDVDFLITHTPPIDHLGQNDWGSKHIQNLLFDVKPRHLHAFGHLHATRGIKKVDGLTLLNCSFVDDNYRPHNRYFVYDTETKELKDVECAIL